MTPVRRPSQRRRRLAEELPICNASKAAWPPGAEATCSSQTLSRLGYDGLRPSAAVLMRMCKSDECMAIARAMRADNPSECMTDVRTRTQLYAHILDKLDATCQALISPPDSGGNSANPTPSPPPPPPPMATASPTLAPKPKPSTSSPVPTQAIASATTTPTDTAGSSSSPPSSEAPSRATPTAIPLDRTPSNVSTTSPSLPPETPVSSAISSPAIPESTRRRPTAPNSSPTATAQQTSSASSSPGISTGTILSVVAGVLVVLIAVLALVSVRRRRRKATTKAATAMVLSPHDATFGTPTSTDYTGDQTASSKDSGQHRRELGRTDLNVALGTLMSWQIDSNELTDVELLGSGSQGAVFLVKLNDSRLLVSKRAVPDQLTEQKLQAMVDEIRLVATLQHPSIVAFVGVAWLTPYDLQALFEYMPNGDLRRHLEETKQEAGGPWTIRKLEMARSVAEGLAYVHSFNPPIVHRDLKARNILLDEAFTAKIGDFGVSRLQSDNGTMTTGIGTSRWLAPEVIRGGGLYTEQCDIYSFGVVLVEMDTHALPFASLEGSVSEIMLLHQVARGERRPPVTQTCDPRIAALVDKCLHQDPSQRPNALEVAYGLRQIIKSG